MARFKIEESKEEKPVETEKPLPVEKFYARYMVYHFNYPVIGKDGKPAFRSNPITGNLVYDSEGNPVPVTKQERFQTLRDRMSKGYLSVAEFDPNNKDPQAQARGEALRNLSKQIDIEVWTEDENDKRENYDRWVEKKRREEAESKISVLESKAAKVEELEKRLAELEGK